MKLSDFVDEGQLRRNSLSKRQVKNKKKQELIESAFEPSEPGTGRTEKRQRISLEKTEEILEETSLLRSLKADLKEQKRALVVKGFMTKVTDIAIAKRKLGAYGW